MTGSGIVTTRRALLSVSDKTELADVFVITSKML